MAVCKNLVPLVNIKIAGKWMFIPLKMVLIGIDPYPNVFQSRPFVLHCILPLSKRRQQGNVSLHGKSYSHRWAAAYATILPGQPLSYVAVHES